VTPKEATLPPGTKYYRFFLFRFEHIRSMRFLVVLFSLALVVAPQARAQETRIAAVVNDDVISVVDLQQRIRMVLLSSNLEDQPQTRQRVAAQVLRNLVDEKLELQEAKRLNVKVGDDEVREALTRIERQNNLKPGGLDAYLRERGIERSTLVEQLKATLAWGKLVRRKLATVSLSEEEVDETLTRMKENEGQPLSRVAEIFLAVDDPRQEEEVHRFADRLFEQMKQGATFPGLAQQFSQSATAAVGGDIGWVTAGQLGGEVGNVVERLNPGEVSPPFRATGGYYMMFLIDRRVSSAAAQDATVSLVQVTFPVAPNAPESERQRAAAQAADVGNTARSCGEMLKLGQERAPQTSGDLGRLKVGELPAELREPVLGLAVAQASKPMPLRGGIGVLMVCARENGSSGASREEVAEMLSRQRAETLARRYLRDLRRIAFVDIRV
jgi:peptidyl-prolyl cis-trans isomerase SurA